MSQHQAMRECMEHRGKDPCTLDLGTLTEMSDQPHILAALTLLTTG